jgi:hypothetical protein
MIRASLVAYETRARMLKRVLCMRLINFTILSGEHGKLVVLVPSDADIKTRKISCSPEILLARGLQALFPA